MAMTRTTHTTAIQQELRRAATVPEFDMSRGSQTPQKAHSALLQAATALKVFQKRERNKMNAEYLASIMQTITLAMLDLEEDDGVWSRYR